MEVDDGGLRFGTREDLGLREAYYLDGGAVEGRDGKLLLLDGFRGGCEAEEGVEELFIVVAEVEDVGEDGFGGALRLGDGEDAGEFGVVAESAHGDDFLIF